MPLTDTSVKNAKPKDKTYKLFDGGGMYLEVTPNGNKWWRLKYRIAGKEKRLALGVYPTISLKDAREKREEARKHLVNNIDPSQIKQAQKASLKNIHANSFETIAREWFIKFSANWVSSHSEKIIARLEKDIFPWLGNKSITDILAPDILSVVRRIESRGALDTAHRALQNCGQIFRYAIATGRAERNPSTDLRGSLPSIKQNHLAAITEPKQVGELLRAIDNYQGSFITKCALKLAPLVFVRPGELRTAEWSEINFETAEWNIPASKMKMREPLLVPLSTQALEILAEIHSFSGSSKYVFPSLRTFSRPMSENAILAALRRMGYSKDEMTGHGFRAMARTLLDEVLGVRSDYIEHQLAHAVRDPNGRAYNRTAHLVERKKMMQKWADYLDELKQNIFNRT